MRRATREQWCFNVVRTLVGVHPAHAPVSPSSTSMYRAHTTDGPRRFCTGSPGLAGACCTGGGGGGSHASPINWSQKLGSLDEATIESLCCGHSPRVQSTELSAWEDPVRQCTWGRSVHGEGEWVTAAIMARGKRGVLLLLRLCVCAFMHCRSTNHPRVKWGPTLKRGCNLRRRVPIPYREREPGSYGAGPKS